jgi:hypothetical protein
MNMDNHAAAALHRNFHQDSPEEECLVHTAVHPVVANHVHNGSLRAEIQPKEAAGWLFEGVGHVETIEAHQLRMRKASIAEHLAGVTPTRRTRLINLSE